MFLFMLNGGLIVARIKWCTTVAMGGLALVVAIYERTIWTGLWAATCFVGADYFTRGLVRLRRER